jgi:aminopeptidase N
MCRIILFCIVCFSIVSPARAWCGSVIDQNISLRLDPDGHRLYATARMTLASEDSAWPKEFFLAAHAKIEEVKANGVVLPYDFSEGRLKLELPVDTAKCVISYSIRYEDPVPQNLVGIEDPSYGVSATILQRGVYLSENSGWHPRADGTSSIFRVEIKAPLAMTGVTAGRLEEYARTETETSVTWQTLFPQAGLALAAGPYELHREELENIQLLVFVTVENSGLAPGYLASIREYLILYQELFGPYPYEKFAVVENFYPTGYGLPGWTLLGSTVIRLPFIRTTSLPHEIAHAWWGNAVEIDYGSGNWGEGLATYVADYYLKELNDPQQALEYRRKLLRDYAALVDAGDDRPLSLFRSRMSKRDQAIGYGKSAMVFHMLRDLIGDEPFWKGLQNVAREGRGQS